MVDDGLLFSTRGQRTPKRTLRPDGAPEAEVNAAHRERSLRVRMQLGLKSLSLTTVAVCESNSGSYARSGAAALPGEGPRMTLPWLGRWLGVAELALGCLEHAGTVLVPALVGTDRLDPGLVALGEHGTDFLHT